MLQMAIDSSILNSNNSPTPGIFPHNRNHHQQITVSNAAVAQIPTANLDMYLTALKHHHHHQQQQHQVEQSDKIRQFVNELLMSKSQHGQQQPSLPHNPPPSLVINNSASQCCPSNVQYSSPWNSSSGGSGGGGNKLTSNSNSLVSNLTGNSTLSGHVMPTGHNQAMNSSQEDEIVNGK